MKRSRFSEEQIIAILKEQEAGMATAEVFFAPFGTSVRVSMQKIASGVGSSRVRNSSAGCITTPPAQAMHAGHRRAMQ